MQFTNICNCWDTPAVVKVSYGRLMGNTGARYCEPKIKRRDARGKYKVL